ncbi:MAG TPA: RNA polymerase sigma factor [Thermoanaerobaculia bacterium]
MEPAARPEPPETPAMPEITELLVVRARARDARAFEELYRQHHGRIYALALRLTRDATRAEELTQDAFVRAWETLPAFRGDSSFATWLHGVTVRVFLERSRADRKWEERIATAEDLSGYLMEVQRAMPETSLALERAIASLPDGARTALVLYAVEGYRYEEIARMLGLALGTIKAQIHRARRLLMEVLQK